MRRRRRRPDRPRTCLTGGCGATIAGWKRLCDACFKRLPFEQRKAIAEAGQSRAPHRVSQLCSEGAAWLGAQEATRAAAAAAATARMMGERSD